MSKPYLFFDAHLDLAMNAMEWNRDLRCTVEQIRQSEQCKSDKPDRGNGTVSFSALRKGNIGIVVGTQIARYTKKSNPLPGASWNSPEQAWAQTQGQLAWYQAMEADNQLRFIRNRQDLDNHLQEWEKDADATPIGLILSLEGADSILSMEHLAQAYAYGLRAIGPAHYGPGTYAYGTNSEGRLGEKGKTLLREMNRLGIILDVTHLSDQSFWEAIDVYQGPLWASHNNCRALVPHQRQFSDEQLKIIIERGGVVGAAFDAWMLSPIWERGKSTPTSADVSLNTVINHIDHICQLAGNCDHIGLGTDLDGAFGTEQCPQDIDTIADLQKLPALLKKRGYTEADIHKITSGNWIQFLRKAWT